MGGEFATSICDTIADAECGGRWSCCRAHARGYGAQTENGRRAAGRREEIIPYMNAFVRACDCAIRSAGRIDSDAGRSPFFLPIDNKEGTPRKQSCGLWPGLRVSSGLGYTLYSRYSPINPLSQLGCPGPTQFGGPPRCTWDSSLFCPLEGSPFVLRSISEN